MLSRQLAEKSICIVSGLARGIDTAAHRGAIEAGGKTIAVLGTGIDDVYPKENSKLLDKILETGGAIVSQFPLKTPPLSDNFPYRNRIISGLSLGVLIVEASERSGSLITARYAIEQGRDVFAVPGNITSRNSFGTNYLIKSGAKLVQQWQDIVAELPSEISNRILSPKTSERETYEIKQEELLPADLTDKEKQLFRMLPIDESVHFDVLVEVSGFSITDLSTALLGLEIRGLVRSLPGNCYIRKT
jgi:DNA processing protein